MRNNQTRCANRLDSVQREFLRRRDALMNINFATVVEGPPVDFHPKDAAAMSNLLQHAPYDPATHTPA